MVWGHITKIYQEKSDCWEGRQIQISEMQILSPRTQGNIFENFIKAN